MSNKDFWEAVKELKPKLFITYAAIYKLADNDVGYCYSTNKGLGEKIGKYKDNIARDVSELKEKGFLYSLEINKKGNHCDERRLYTNSGLRTYIEDKRNIKDLIKTKTETKDGVVYFYNERNPYPQEGIVENDNRGIVENNNRGIVENDKGTITNITNTKTTTSDGPPEDSLVRKTLDTLSYKTSEGTIKNIEALNPTQERLEAVINWAVNNNMGGGAIISAIKNNWEVSTKGTASKLTKNQAREKLRDIANYVKTRYDSGAMTNPLEIFNEKAGQYADHGDLIMEYQTKLKEAIGGGI